MSHRRSSSRFRTPLFFEPAWSRLASRVTVDSAHEERIELHSGQELWDWCLSGNPIPGMLVADLRGEQKAAMIRSLDVMLRDRADAAGVATLTAPLNIGIGTK